GCMFAWLGKWFGRKDSFAMYNPRQRATYSYFDGTAVRPVDPLILYKRLMDKGPELAIDIKVSQSASKDAAKAHAGLVAKIREIFTVKPLEEGGLSEVEAIALFEHFVAY